MSLNSIVYTIISWTIILNFVQTLNTQANEMGANKGPQKLRSLERPHNVNVITSLDSIVDPITIILPVNEPKHDLVKDEIQTNEHQMTNPVLDLNPDDDELPADYLEIYDMHGRSYINKYLQKKIIVHKRIREAGQFPLRPSTGLTGLASDLTRSSTRPVGLASYPTQSITV